MTTLLALDIGGTKVGWGIVRAGDSYEVTECGSIPTDAMRGGADGAARIGDLVGVTGLDDAPPDLGATDVEGKERSHEDPYEKSGV